MPPPPPPPPPPPLGITNSLIGQIAAASGATAAILSETGLSILSESGDPITEE